MISVQVRTNCGRRLQSAEGLSLRIKNGLYFLVKSKSPEPRGLQVLNVLFQVRNVPFALRDGTLNSSVIVMTNASVV